MYSHALAKTQLLARRLGDSCNGLATTFSPMPSPNSACEPNPPYKLKFPPSHHADKRKNEADGIKIGLTPSGNDGEKQ